MVRRDRDAVNDAVAPIIQPCAVNEIVDRVSLGKERKNTVYFADSKLMLPIEQKENIENIEGESLK